VKDFSLPTRKDIEENEDPDKDPEGFDPENLADEMDISSDPEIVKINVKSKDSNQPKKWYMKELTVPRRAYYLNRLKPHFERDGQTIKDFKMIQESLLGEVLFDEETDEAVQLAEIQELPTKSVDKLYMRATYMNGLDKGAQARAKKSLSKTAS
jgi:hypothetical protein